MKALLVLVGLMGNAHAEEIVGDWTGKVMPNVRLVFHISSAPGGYLATLDSPDQGALGIAVAKAAFANGVLTLDVSAIGSKFEGRLVGKELDGVWAQGGQKISFKLHRARPGEIAPPKRPQEPKKPYPYREEEVTVPLQSGGTLSGTLTLPSTKGPFVAVLLVSGSGPQDRDESLMGHRPFWVLADALTRRGIAVLRCDDRGVGKSTGDRTKATTLDYAEDALASVAFLKARKDIARVGVLGHSEGGLIAPIMATKSNEVAFIVLLAGTGVTGEEIMRDQQAAIARANGSSEADVVALAKVNAEAFALLQKKDALDEKDVDALYAKLPESERKQIEKPQFAGMLKSISGPWFRTFLKLDPKTFLQQVRVPALVLNGARDLQVSAALNLPVIEAAFRAGKNGDVTIRKLDGLNHLFQHAKTGSPDEYQKIEETFAPEALQLIGDWILSHVKK